MIEQGKTADAAEALRRVMGQGKTSPRIRNLLGICEVRLGHREMAQELFSGVLAEQPRNPAALTNMGNLSLLGGDTATAGNFYIRALRENVFLVEPRLNLVRCYQDMGHFEKAMTAYEEYVAVVRMNWWGKVALASLALILLLLLARR